MLKAIVEPYRERFHQLYKILILYNRFSGCSLQIDYTLVILYRLLRYSLISLYKMHKDKQMFGGAEKRLFEHGTLSQKNFRTI